MTRDTCQYNVERMIGSLKNKGLKRLYEKDDRSGIRPDLVDNLERILTLLDAASTPYIACTSSKAIGRVIGP